MPLTVGCVSPARVVALLLLLSGFDTSGLDVEKRDDDVVRPPKRLLPLVVVPGAMLPV